MSSEIEDDSQLSFISMIFLSFSLAERLETLSVAAELGSISKNFCISVHKCGRLSLTAAQQVINSVFLASDVVLSIDSSILMNVYPTMAKCSLRVLVFEMSIPCTPLIRCILFAWFLFPGCNFSVACFQSFFLELKLYAFKALNPVNFYQNCY